MPRRQKIVQCYYEIPDNASPQARWLLNLLNEHNYSIAGLAKKIHTTRTAIYNWFNGTDMSFGSICAVVCMVDKNADPEALYKLFRHI